jgi:hypothetical protein
VDSRLQRAISTPKIQQQAGELVDRALRALEDLRQLDENLYERFVETRKAPEGPDAAANRIRKLWDETFRGLLGLLDFCKTLTGALPATTTDDSAAFDFGDFGESAPAPSNELELGAADIGELLSGLDSKEQSDSERWKPVLEKVSSIEYGLRAQYGEATERREVALGTGEMNQVLGLLDDTTSAASEGVHALVAAVYEAFVPDVNPTTIVPGYLTTLGRALLVRRGLADLATKLAAHNETLQSSERADEHQHALTAVRSVMRQFVGSVVCRAMRAADRWQMVEFERDLSGQPLSVARLTSEGLVKYIESLSSINQREVLVLHDQRTIEEMRDALASARQLVDLSPKTAREEMERAYQAALRLRGRHPVTDTLIIQLERYSSTASGQQNSAKLLERLEAVLAATG